MTIFLTIIACLLLLIGLAGCVVPVLPGPPLGYIGLLFAYWSGADVSVQMLIIMALVVIVVTVIDFYLPVIMTRRFGGSRAATLGSAIGLFAGLFLFPPIGLIVCPFLGALIGQLIHDKGERTDRALKVAFGSFAAFALGTGLKLTTVGVMIFIAVKAMFF